MNEPTWMSSYPKSAEEVRQLPVAPSGVRLWHPLLPGMAFAVEQEDGTLLQVVLVGDQWMKVVLKK